MTVKNKGLKKGTLEFLLSSSGLDDTVVLEEPESINNNNYQNSKGEDSSRSYSNAGLGLLNLPIEKIQRSPYQPRKIFSPSSLQDLADSIKAKGLIQPIIVRRLADSYELIAGERRWRAAQIAGLHNIPAVIKDVDDETALVMAIVENMQREDLNPIEEARGLQRLVDEFAMTQQQVAEVVGKSRTAVTNALRLLGLNPEVQLLVEDNKLEMGHARALLSLSHDQQLVMANKIIAKQASVRDAEQWVRETLQPQHAKAEQNNIYIEDPNIKILQTKLSETLGANVLIKHEKTGRGQLVISYNSIDELDGIMAKIQ
jgi:ParB family chromosome partitioning protein